MSEAPLEAPFPIHYSEILFMNDSWTEATHPNRRFKSYVAVPASDEKAKIILKDLNGEKIELCFDIGTILFEGSNLMWYNEAHLVEC